MDEYKRHWHQWEGTSVECEPPKSHHLDIPTSREAERLYQIQLAQYGMKKEMMHDVLMPRLPSMEYSHFVDASKPLKPLDECSGLADRRQKMILKKKIEAALYFYKVNELEPPYSFQELVVMAIICIKASGKTEHISNWLVDEVLYYRVRYQHEPHMLVSRINNTICQYELPISATQTWAMPVANRSCCAVPLKPARFFLRHALYKRRGTFKFMELPPELRLRIYEMVLSYPEIIVGGHCSDGASLCFSQQEHADDWETDFILHPDPYRLRFWSRPLQKILAILSVNKEVYQEAMPVFYQISHFRVPGNLYLPRWLAGLPTQRLRHIKHLYLNYRPSAVSSDLKSGLRILKKYSKLKTLEIETESWQYFGGRRDLGPEEMPYLKELMAVVRRSEEVWLRGDCPKLEKYLREQKRSNPEEDEGQ